VDHALFDFINQQLANPVLDVLFPLLREKTTWIPLYVVWAFLLWRGYGWRRTLYLLVCVAIVLTVADQLAASVFKPWIGRLRPCAEPSVAEQARILVGCGGKFGFPSNHATNHFAVATVLSLTWIRRWPGRAAIFLWAASISIAQVYVGKHYPGDVVAGALFGSTVAFLGVVVYRRLAGRWVIN